MKLYHSPFSSNARKVRMAAMLLGIELDLVEVDLAKGEQRRPEFLALNPAGRVPVLQDGAFVLSESAAIMAYLADTKPGNTLYPRDPKERADVHQWLFWTASHFGPAFAALTFERWLKALLQRGAPDPAQIERQEEALRASAAVLERDLATREWVAGATLTIADLAIAASLGIADRAQFSLQPFPAIAAWFERVRALDAWRATEPPARRP